MKSINPFILMILDGWGIGDKSKSDAIYNANTPNIDFLKQKYPNSFLLTCGENVGLPEGQMGNSEVGHLNIGSGRVVYQDLVRINKATRDGSFEKNEVLLDALLYAKKNNKAVHLLGLVSDGGVHSEIKHLYKLCDMAKNEGLSKVYIHALLDGRDCDPHSGLGFIEDLQKHLKNSAGQIATICGRYYTMDRDKRWERIKQGYDLMVHGNGKKMTDPVEAVRESYIENVTDEFVKPIVIVNSKGLETVTVQPGDVFICFNFRTDRLREITTALTQQEFPDYDMQTMGLHYVTMTNYKDTFKNIKVAFDKVNVNNTLGKIFSKLGYKQLRIAETEKYPHVTFFFSGRVETIFSGEKRIMISSPKVATYDLQPEMSAYLVKDALVTEINKKNYDFICVNFANGDMVGHTGIYDAIIKAVETVDICVKEVVDAAEANDYSVMIIADHGNADFVINPDGSPNTAHSLNPVPCILVTNKYRTIKSGVLADVAPTILKIMDLEIPSEMTGTPLI